MSNTFVPLQTGVREMQGESISDCPIQTENQDQLIQVTLGGKRVIVYPLIVTKPLSSEELKEQLLRTGYHCEGEESLRTIREVRPDLITDRELYALAESKKIGDRICFPFVQRDEENNLRFGFGSPTDQHSRKILSGTRILVTCCRSTLSPILQK